MNKSKNTAKPAGLDLDSTFGGLVRTRLSLLCFLFFKLYSYTLLMSWEFRVSWRKVSPKKSKPPKKGAYQLRTIATRAE